MTIEGSTKRKSQEGTSAPEPRRRGGLQRWRTSRKSDDPRRERKDDLSVGLIRIERGWCRVDSNLTVAGGKRVYDFAMPKVKGRTAGESLKYKMLEGGRETRQKG